MAIALECSIFSHFTVALLLRKQDTLDHDKRSQGVFAHTYVHMLQMHTVGMN